MKSRDDSAGVGMAAVCRVSGSPVLTRGATLLEVMLALTVLALIGVMLYAGIEQTLGISTQLDSELETLAVTEVMLDRMSDELHAAFLRPGSRWTVFSGQRLETGCVVTFSTLIGGLHQPPTAIRYRYQHTAAGEGVLYWSVSENPFLPPPEGMVWRTGIERMEMSYLYKNQWFEEWNSETGSVLPEAVRVRIDGADGSAAERIIIIPCGGDR
ncbi:hypothetical protein JW905_19125 [bacterium]|nr:hypothetical protein [candidate division CSSED10-310 bacterium]